MLGRTDQNAATEEKMLLCPRQTSGIPSEIRPVRTLPVPSHDVIDTAYALSLTLCAKYD
jgi:hypothetical protein